VEAKDATVVNVVGEEEHVVGLHDWQNCRINVQIIEQIVEPSKEPGGVHQREHFAGAPSNQRNCLVLGNVDDD
jgi:hypothetical protein